MVTRNKSLSEQREANHAALDYYSKLSGKPTPDAQLALHVVKPKRAYTKGASNDIEAPVVAAISELLAKHPKVLIAMRMNSGAMRYDNAHGQSVPVWFHRWLKAPKHMRMVDFFGFTIDHKPFAIEAKKPSWTKPTDERERQQQVFIETIWIMGGRSGFATSVDEAQLIIELP